VAARGQHGHSPGLQRVKSATSGATLVSAQDVEDYAATVAATEPMDSAGPFSPNPAHFPAFLNDLTLLFQEESDFLEVPFTMPELAATVEEAAPNMSPGLDGLSYEFYCATHPLIGLYF
jgi:hypothetical protein